MKPSVQKIIYERNNKSEPSAAPAEPLGILALLRSGTMWSIALAHGCGIYSQYLYLTWLPTYLVNVRGLTILNAGFYTAMPYLAAAIVNVALGWFSDKTLTWRRPAKASGANCWPCSSWSRR